MDQKKTNTLLNSRKEQDRDSLIDKVYLYAKYLSEAKYQFFMKKHQDIETEHSNDSKAFI